MSGQPNRMNDEIVQRVVFAAAGLLIILGGCLGYHYGQAAVHLNILAGVFSFSVLAGTLASLYPHPLITMLREHGQSPAAIMWAPLLFVIGAALVAIAATQLDIFANMTLWYAVAAVTGFIGLAGQIQMVRFIRSAK
jgi:hypothetical protein